MSAIHHLSLRVSSLEVVNFYVEHLGMVQGPDGVYRFPGQREGLSFVVDHLAPPADGGANAGYWKIGVTTADVDTLVERLRSAGQRVSEPSQFRDIGYLCHLQDPDGLTTELLAHRFHNASPADGPLRLGQVTLRIADPKASLAFYQEQLGLTLLSVQPVEPYRFTLYFLASTRERPPHSDLQSVDNREWLWQRPYTTLELQHRWDSVPEPARTTSLGYDCLVFGEGEQECLDPDGHHLRV